MSNLPRERSEMHPRDAMSSIRRSVERRRNLSEEAYRFGKCCRKKKKIRAMTANDIERKCKRLPLSLSLSFSLSLFLALLPLSGPFLAPLSSHTLSFSVVHSSSSHPRSLLRSFRGHLKFIIDNSTRRKQAARPGRPR